MIDPKEFLGSSKKEEYPQDAIDVSGTFACQECNEKSTEAKLDESKGVLIYYCTNGHRSQARL